MHSDDDDLPAAQVGGAKRKRSAAADRAAAAAVQRAEAAPMLRQSQAAADGVTRRLDDRWERYLQQVRHVYADNLHRSLHVERGQSTNRGFVARAEKGEDAPDEPTNPTRAGRIHNRIQWQALERTLQRRLRNMRRAERALVDHHATATRELDLPPTDADPRLIMTEVGTVLNMPAEYQVSRAQLKAWRRTQQPAEIRRMRRRVHRGDMAPLEQRLGMPEAHQPYYPGDL